MSFALFFCFAQESLKKQLKKKKKFIRENENEKQKGPKRGYVGLLVYAIFMYNSVFNFRLLVHVHECDLPKNYKKKESWKMKEVRIGIVILLV